MRTLVCGESHAWNNSGVGATDLLDGYSCVAWDESGPEYAYRFEPTRSGKVEARLSNLTADLDLFVLGGAGGLCEADACLGYAAGKGKTLVFDAEAGQTYYLVVDGYRGAVSNYTLRLTCQDRLFLPLVVARW